MGSRWRPQQVVSFMDAHPSRAYFSRLFSDGGFRVGMEVGVAHGRFSEHFLLTGKPAQWWMVEPYPTDELQSRLAISSNGSIDRTKGSWAERRIGSDVHVRFLLGKSMDHQVRRMLVDGLFDFVYLDGAHDYRTVQRELHAYWPLVRPGGVLAGHDYCDHGEKSSALTDLRVPRCQPYTEYGVRHGKPAGKMAQSQHGVVNAVHEWLAAERQRSPTHARLLKLHHTLENFTRRSLAADGLDYDLVITSTYNPSFYFVKPP